MTWFMSSSAAATDIVYENKRAYFIYRNKKDRRRVDVWGQKEVPPKKDGVGLAKIVGVTVGFPLSAVKTLFPHAFIWNLNKTGKANLPDFIRYAWDHLESDLNVTNVQRELKGEPEFPVKILKQELQYEK